MIQLGDVASIVFLFNVENTDTDLSCVLYSGIMGGLNDSKTPIVCYILLDTWLTS